MGSEWLRRLFKWRVRILWDPLGAETFWLIEISVHHSQIFKIIYIYIDYIDTYMYVYVYDVYYMYTYTYTDLFIFLSV